ncbi:hypothetical protein VM636_14055 [Streptomyces sp. SCSIO 75703]|uniref:hypothetical protein n=1 Tax=unclassified Streptomyces TaxID=2593676 RepID=UPI0004C2528F|nr:MULTISPECIES: hypothetical protein [unclassified Streptomyces]
MNERPAATAPADSPLVAQLIELAKHLEVANKRHLRTVLHAVTADYRVQRIQAIGQMAQNLLGQLFAAGLVGGFLFLAYHMVQRGESGYAVLLAGFPASSMAGIFVLRVLPDFKAMSAFARQANALAANGSAAVPAQAGPGTAPAGVPPSDGAPV